jgi:hypothetical protein
MPREEGFRRMKQIARALTTTGAGLIALWAAILFIAMFSHWVDAWLGIFFWLGLVLGICLLAQGCVLWAAVWVAEGFVQGPDFPRR